MKQTSMLASKYKNLDLFEKAKTAIAHKLENDIASLKGDIQKAASKSDPKSSVKVYSLGKKSESLVFNLEFVKNAKAADFVKYVDPEIKALKDAIKDQSEILKGMRANLKAAKQAV